MEIRSSLASYHQTGAIKDLLVWSEHSEGQKWVYCKGRFKLEGLFLEQTLPKALYLILYL